MATFYLDFEGGDDSKDGTTFANRWKTITSGATAARTAPGDTIRIMKSPDPVSLGVNGTFTKQSATVTLASAVSANISLCTAGWTASANVTSTTSTTRKEGTVSTSIAPNATFTTGVLAYEATGTLDLSAYQNVSLWVRSSIALAANALRLDLCTDTAGATPAHSFTIDTAFAANTWKPITFKNGSALNSAIKSVALTALTDFGAATILIDNIIATNDLHFNSLIGTSSSATGRIWYPIRSIDGTSVIIGIQQNDGTASISRGWHAATTTTTAYVRDTIRLSASQTINEDGTYSGYINYSGGWDRTNMSSQNGMTFLLNDTNITSGTGFNCSTLAYLRFEWLSFLWGDIPVTGSGASHRVISCGEHGTGNYWRAGNGSFLNNFYHISCNTEFGILISGKYDGLYSYSCNGNGIVGTSMVAYASNIESVNSNLSGLTDISGIWQNITAKDNGAYGLRWNNPRMCEINGLNTSGNSTAGINANGLIKINNAVMTDLNPLDLNTGIQTRVSFSRYSTYKGYIYYATTAAIYDSTAVLHGSSSISWRHDVWVNDGYVPMVQPLQPFAVGASTLVTFKIWVRRDSTNVEGRVRLKGYVTPGVDADVTATITAAINTWEQLTVTCTPSAAGVVQIDLESYSVNGSTGTVYFGDATVSQA